MKIKNRVIFLAIAVMIVLAAMALLITQNSTRTETSAFANIKATGAAGAEYKSEKADDLEAIINKIREKAKP